MSLPRFLKDAFKGFDVVDVKEVWQQGMIEIHLNRREDKDWCCHRCGEILGVERGKHRSRIEGMPVMGLRVWIHFWRHKGHCRRCQKARSECVEFVSEETPHLTTDFAWWVGRMCEIAAISRVAELLE